MQSLSTFIRISGAIPEVKNPAFINDYEKYCTLSKTRRWRASLVCLK